MPKRVHRASSLDAPTHPSARMRRSHQIACAAGTRPACPRGPRTRGGEAAALRRSRCDWKRSHTSGRQSRRRSWCCCSALLAPPRPPRGGRRCLGPAATAVRRVVVESNLSFGFIDENICGSHVARAMYVRSTLIHWAGVDTGRQRFRHHHLAVPLVNQ